MDILCYQSVTFVCIFAFYLVTENNDCWGANKCGTGECIDGINTFTCSCEEGQTGRNCDYSMFIILTS